jgi:hypothetical protein
MEARFDDATRPERFAALVWSGREHDGAAHRCHSHIGSQPQRFFGAVVPCNAVSLRGLPRASSPRTGLPKGEAERCLFFSLGGKWRPRTICSTALLWRSCNSLINARQIRSQRPTRPDPAVATSNSKGVHVSPADPANGRRSAVAPTGLTEVPECPFPNSCRQERTIWLILRKLSIGRSDVSANT